MTEDEQMLAKAKKVYKAMIAGLNKKEWNFDEDEEKLTIYSSCTGEDIPMKFIVRIDAEREVIKFLSPMPFSMAEDKRVDGAIAVCVANYGLVNGSFDYDVTDGSILFRLTTSYAACEIGEDFFMDMISTALWTADKYNDKFLMLSKGVITLQQFMESDK